MVSLVFSFFPLLVSTVSVALLSPFVSAGIDKAAPFDRNNYPAFDARLVEWPVAEHSVPLVDHPFVAVDCYTQLGRSAISPIALFRLNNSMTLSHRACLLRIPTGTRLTVVDMHTTNRKTYAIVLAGVSHVEMPLRTAYIHRDQKEKYGPWHVPCQHAYLVLNSHGHGLEWVEFRLDEETDEDRHTADAMDCFADASVNYADREYRRTGTDK